MSKLREIGLELQGAERRNAVYVFYHEMGVQFFTVLVAYKIWHSSVTNYVERQILNST